MAKPTWLHVTNSMHGGVGRVIENLAGTVMKGFDQKICELDSGRAPGIVSAARKFLAARAALRSLPPGSIAHLHCGLRSWLYAGPKKTARCIVTIHGMVPPKGVAVPGDIVELRLLAKRLSPVVAVSRHCGKTMRRMAGRAFPIAVIPNGVPEPSRSGPARSGSIVNVGFVGYLFPHKGIDTFLEVARILSGSRARFLVFGDGPKGPMVEAAQRDGLVRWVRGKTAPHAIYPEIDVLSFPSQPCGPDVTGCPMVLLEAKSYGVPAIAGSIPGAAELIENDADGILVEGFDPHDHAAAIDRLITANQMRRKLSVCAKERWAAGYTARLMADRYLQLARENF